jgi:hypothetical protein
MGSLVCTLVLLECTLQWTVRSRSTQIHHVLLLGEIGHHGSVFAVLRNPRLFRTGSKSSSLNASQNVRVCGRSNSRHHRTSDSLAAEPFLHCLSLAAFAIPSARLFRSCSTPVSQCPRRRPHRRDLRRRTSSVDPVGSIRTRRMSVIRASGYESTVFCGRPALRAKRRCHHGLGGSSAAQRIRSVIDGRVFRFARDRSIRRGSKCYTTSRSHPPLGRRFASASHV